MPATRRRRIQSNIVLAETDANRSAWLSYLSYISIRPDVPSSFDAGVRIMNVLSNPSRQTDPKLSMYPPARGTISNPHPGNSTKDSICALYAQAGMRPHASKVDDAVVTAAFLLNPESIVSRAMDAENAPATTVSTITRHTHAHHPSSAERPFACPQY